jgi:hypothetical protein
VTTNGHPHTPEPEDGKQLSIAQVKAQLASMLANGVLTAARAHCRRGAPPEPADATGTEATED